MEVVKFEAQQKISMRDRKMEEAHVCHGWKALTIKNGKMWELVDLRIGCTDGAAYACVWVCTGSGYGVGSGRAGGYGYHRASAAAGAALHNAGVTLSEDINGRGDSAIWEAVQAVGDYLAGGSPVYVVEFYG